MSNEIKKVVVYARVSSDRQDVDLSISAQLKAMREYAKRNDYLVIKEYIDEADSGRSIDRPGFKEMILAARQKPPQFQMILVWKLSRFARNREDSIIYKSLLRKQGIQVISINEPLEDTPSGRLLEGIIEVLDEFYSANLGQDVTRGMRECASRGFYPGGIPPFGFKRIKVPDGAVQRVKLDPDPATAPIVERMFRENLDGKGLVEICQGLNADGLTTPKRKKWGKTTVNAILKNEAYIGTLIWGKYTLKHENGKDLPLIRVENAWPGIIEKDIFSQVQLKLESRAPKVTHPRIIHSEYILSGLLKCKHCGFAMVGHAVKSGKFFYYMCGNARKRGKGLCTTPLLPKERIEKYVVDRVKKYILTEENLYELVKITNENMAQSSSGEADRLAAVKTQLEEVDNRLAKLYDALETGEFKSGELAPRIKVLFDKKEELQKAKLEAEEGLKNHILEITSPDAVKQYIQDLRSKLEDSSIISKKSFLRWLIDRIDVDENFVKFTYPLFKDAPPSETVGVLPFIHDGPPLAHPRYKKSTLWLQTEYSRKPVN